MGPDLGHILVPVSGSIFGRGFGALDFVCNCSGDLIQLCNKQQLQPKKEGKLGGQNCSNIEHEYLGGTLDWSPEMYGFLVYGFLGAKIRLRLDTPFCVYCTMSLHCRFANGILEFSMY